FALRAGQWPSLISTSTPAARSSFIRASTVCGVGSTMSSRRLWVRISNCSRLFLSICGERNTVNRSIRVGSGIGPRTCAPVRLAVFTISLVDWSSTRWSNALRRMRIFWLSMVNVRSATGTKARWPFLLRGYDGFRPYWSFDDLGDDAGADGAAALADGEAQALVHGDRRDQLHLHRHVVARHHHLRPLRQHDLPRHVRRPEVELRPVVREERRVP